MRPRPAISLGMVAVALGVAFAVLGVWVEVAGSIPGEVGLLETIDRWFGSRADSMAEAIDAATDTDPLAVVAIVAAGAFVVVHRWRDGLAVVVIAAVVMIVNPWWKDVFARPRPTVRPILIDVSELAFPSGHAAMSAAVVGGVVLGAWPTGARIPVALVGAAVLWVVALAQLMLGAHHPSDIVAGWLWAAALVTGVGAGARRIGRSSAATTVRC